MDQEDTTCDVLKTLFEDHNIATLLYHPGLAARLAKGTRLTGSVVQYKDLRFFVLDWCRKFARFPLLKASDRDTIKVEFHETLAAVSMYWPKNSPELFEDVDEDHRNEGEDEKGKKRKIKREEDEDDHTGDKRKDEKREKRKIKREKDEDDFRRLKARRES